MKSYVAKQLQSARRAVSSELFRKTLVLINCFVMFSLSFSSVSANPTNGQVSYGNATIQQAPQSTVINQTSNKAIINWHSFNIASDESTRFQQPSTQSITLNRINPNQGASQIFGKLSSNGQIILVNQAGLFFGPGAHIDVGGIIASTSDISNDNFIAGKYIFDQPSSFGGSIINRGTIIAAENGLVALVGTNVSNEGMIQANVGRVALASGNKFTVDLTGDQLINFVTVDEAATQPGKSPIDGSELTSAVSNSGKIIANGGKVLLTAESSSRVLDNVINMKGIVVANSVNQRNGEIILSGGSGTVKVTGKIIASGKQTAQRGGKIKILAKKVIVTDDALIDVSGDVGGGTALIGGDYQGKNPAIPNADHTFIGDRVSIKADALTAGNGGKVIIWANNKTQVYGAISAQGGLTSGNGGFIETSGKQLDVSNSKIDARAPQGLAGLWLLDPSDLTISNAVTSHTDFASDTYTADQPNPSTTPNLNVDDLVNALNSANILVLTTLDGMGGNGDIFVDTPITWSSNNSLTLSAYQNIILNADITNNNPLSAANLVLRADNTGTGVGTICGAGGVCAGSGVASLAGSGIVTAYYNPLSFGTQDTLYVGGTQPEAYMLVNNATNLADMNNYSLSAGQNYALGRDIDLASISNFTPIFTFNAKFDGQNYTLSNLQITNTSDNANLGLFSITDGATISNVNLTGIVLSTSGDNNNVGGLIGYAANTTISNVRVGGSIDVSWDNVTPIYNQYTGGIVGQLDSNSMLSNSISHTDVTSNVGNSNGYFHIGGVIGTNLGSLLNTIADGTLSLTQSSSDAGFDVGGLVGSNFGSINGNGIIGSSSSGMITISSNVGSGVNQNIGGLTGFNSSNINYVISSAEVDVNGNNEGGNRGVGGLVGSNNNGSISNASYTGNIQLNGDSTSVVDMMSNISYANDNIGGLIGNNNNNDTITQLNLVSSGAITVTGNVTGASRYVGGLMGVNQGTLVDSGSSTNINVSGMLTAIYLAGDYPNNANEHVGGLIGSNNNSSSTAYLMQNLTSSGNLIVSGENSGSWRYIGGLFGTNSESNLNNATSSNVISVTTHLSNIYIAGPLNPNVSAGENIGGLIGSNFNSITPLLQNLMSAGSLTVQGDSDGSGRNIGGLMGSNRGTVIDANSTTAVSVNNKLTSIYLSGSFSENANNNVGGSIGNNDNNGQSSYLENLMSSGNVNVTGDNIGGYRNIGGLIGNNSNSAISQSSSTSDIQVSSDLSAIYLVGDFSQNASDSIGGLIGNSNHNLLTLQNISSSGNINITGDATGSGRAVGGLLGSSQGSVDTASSEGSIQVTGNLFVVDTGAPMNPIQSGYESIGGLMGYSNDGLIQNTLSSSPITIVADFMTGVANTSSSTINVGGLIAANNNTSQINASTSSGDITVTAPNVSMSSISIGGFASSNNNSISQSTTSGKMNAIVNLDQGSLSVGGFVAGNGGTISDSTTTRSITVVGPNSTPSAPIQAAIIDSQLSVGGFAGFNVGTISANNITGPINTGDIYTAVTVSRPNTFLSLNLIGGLVGQVFTGSIISGLQSGSSITSNVTNNGGISLVGGVIGLNQAALGTDPALVSYYSTQPINITVTNSNSGLVFIGGAAGGVLENLGQAYSVSPVTVSILNNTTDGIIGIGGLAGGVITAGPTPPSLTNSYSMGAVNVSGQNNGGSVYVGGLLGLNGVSNSPLGPLPGGTVSNTYSTGKVTMSVASSSGQVAVGGLVGNIDSSGTVNNSFWDTATSTQSIGVGSGVGNNVVGGCLGGGSCAGGGSADLSAQNTFTSAGWDFTTTWGIIEGISYPYLSPGMNPNPRVVTGFANADSTVGLAYYGSTMTTTANDSGSFYFLVPNLADGDPLLAYLSGGISNIITLAPQNGGSVIGLTFTPNTFVIGDAHNYLLSNTLLSQAIGSLVNNDILYTATNSNLLFGNATTPELTVRSTPSTTYTLDGNILSYFGITDNFIFNGPVNLASDATINVSQLQFNSTLNGAYNLTLDVSGSTGFAQAVGNVSPLQNLEINSDGGITVLQNITTSGNQSYFNNVQLGDNTIFTGNDIIFVGDVTGNDVTQLTVNKVGNNSQISGELSRIANFVLNGSGTLTLNQMNSYFAPTVVNAGFLKAGVVNAFSPNSDFTLTASGVLDFNNFNNTLGSLTGVGVVNLGSGTLTTGNAQTTSFGGTINGSGGLTKQGTGTFALTQANFYSGLTLINAGTLEITDSSQLGTNNSVVVNSAGTLKINNATIQGFDLQLNGGTLLGTGNAGWNDSLSFIANGYIGTSSASDRLTLFGDVNGTGSLTLQGLGSILLNGPFGNVTTPDSLLSNAAYTFINNGGITTTSSQIYNGMVSLGADTTLTVVTNGFLALNGGITGNNYSLNLTGTNSQFLISDSLNGVNNLNVTGNGSNNTLIVNTDNPLQWNINSLNTGEIVNTALANQFTFTGIQNLTGGNKGNTFIFADNASIEGSINGGNVAYPNTLDYSLYTTPIKVSLANLFAGDVQNNLNEVITRFININNLIGSNDSELQLGTNPSTLTFSTATSGLVSDLINFNQFKTFATLNSTDQVIFIASALYNYLTEELMITDIIVPITGFNPALFSGNITFFPPPLPPPNPLPPSPLPPNPLPPSPSPLVIFNPLIPGIITGAGPKPLMYSIIDDKIQIVIIEKPTSMFVGPITINGKNLSE